MPNTAEMRGYALMEAARKRQEETSRNRSVRISRGLQSGTSADFIWVPCTLHIMMSRGVRLKRPIHVHDEESIQKYTARTDVVTELVKRVQ